MRPTTSHSPLPPAQREAGTYSQEQSASEARGIIVTVHAESSNGDGTQDLEIALKGLHSPSGQEITLLSDTFTGGATGVRQYLVYPGASDTQGVYEKLQATPLPKSIKVEATVTSGGDASYTFSVSDEHLLK